ncbi:hypothetical protein PPERSA_10803 [Pseudocohnilembus persalinus]|uniref:EF-hand domain-containing protein n=1 Tax=Pseudocohnilembus persalinus TaxID=266149 RepID=A0A0V0QDU6_PSEPJ|nr:hypothetical protein PPERSA_10803 [Pseudocohnilembus persalinus]|eukprot:KRX00304.1 hypothetical protein PPERSA_10803 [Pseudocohnilembus persalinus]
MLTDLQVFELYDKNKKRYLNKHELKLALIYVLGFKLRYDEIKKIWNQRLDYNEVKFDRDLIQQGIVFQYFVNVKNKILKQIREEKRLQLDFKILNAEKQDGFINFQDFKDLIEESGHFKFLDQAKLQSIFQAFDLDKDGKINLQDFINGFKLSAEEIE